MRHQEQMQQTWHTNICQKWQNIEEHIGGTQGHGHN